MSSSEKEQPIEIVYEYCIQMKTSFRVWPNCEGSKYLPTASFQFSFLPLFFLLSSLVFHMRGQESACGIFSDFSVISACLPLQYLRRFLDVQIHTKQRFVTSMRKTNFALYVFNQIWAVLKTSEIFQKYPTFSGKNRLRKILFQLENQKWYFVTKIVLTNVEKKLF